MKRIQIPHAGGADLSAIEAGRGYPLVMIPGWSQTAAEFNGNIEALAKTARVIALDMRGHGESDKPTTGYRIAKLAHDLAEVMDRLGLERADLLGHSMGSSVIWSYLDLFGPDRVRKLVIVDQAPCVTAKPGWSDSEKSSFGCLFPDATTFGGFYSTVASTGDVEGTMNILKGMFTAGFPAKQLHFIAEEKLKFPRLQAADLLHDHCYLDWRDVIASIRLETLVIGGDKSIFSTASQRWIAANIPDAEVDIFPEAEGGGHFMFFENPARFNARVTAFLAK